MDRLCECGNKIQGRQANRCSRECYNASRGFPTAPKLCATEGCGNIFERPLKWSRKQWEAAKFCSAACAGCEQEDRRGGMSQTEVAERLGLTVWDVARIEKRALRKLREAVESNPAIMEMLCQAS